MAKYVLIPNKDCGKKTDYIFHFDTSLINDIVEYLSSNLSTELAGFLFGKIIENNVKIIKFCQAKNTINSKSSVEFTPQTWLDFYEVKTSLYKDLDVLGWVHSHPNIGVFLSKQDETVNMFFNNIAVVYDPIIKEIGFYDLSIKPREHSKIYLSDNKLTCSFKNYTLHEEE